MRSDAVPMASLTAATYRVADELSVFDAATGVAVCLNSTAAAVFLRVDGVATVGEIVEALARLYDVDAREMADQVTAALESLADAHLVSVDGARTPWDEEAGQRPAACA